jgi:hypothetical protein
VPAPPALTRALARCFTRWRAGHLSHDGAPLADDPSGSLMNAGCSRMARKSCEPRRQLVSGRWPFGASSVYLNSCGHFLQAGVTPTGCQRQTSSGRLACTSQLLRPVQSSPKDPPGKQVDTRRRKCDHCPHVIMPNAPIPAQARARAHACARTH